MIVHKIFLKESMPCSLLCYSKKKTNEKKADRKMSEKRKKAKKISENLFLAGLVMRHCTTEEYRVKRLLLYAVCIGFCVADPVPVSVLYLLQKKESEKTGLFSGACGSNFFPTGCHWGRRDSDYTGLLRGERTSHNMEMEEQRKRHRIISILTVPI